MCQIFPRITRSLTTLVFQFLSSSFTEVLSQSICPSGVFPSNNDWQDHFFQFDHGSHLIYVLWVLSLFSIVIKGFSSSRLARKVQSPQLRVGTAWPSIAAGTQLFNPVVAASDFMAKHGRWPQGSCCSTPLLLHGTCSQFMSSRIWWSLPSCYNASCTSISFVFWVLVLLLSPFSSLPSS